MSHGNNIIAVEVSVVFVVEGQGRGVGGDGIESANQVWTVLISQRGVSTIRNATSTTKYLWWYE